MELWPPKDPEEILDYELDWTDRLESETIASSLWAIESGTVEILEDAPHEQEITGAVTKLWLSGGTLGESCIITNTILTSANRTREFSAKVKIKAK